MNVETLVFICIYVCACITLFDVFFFVYSIRFESTAKRLAVELESVISGQLERLKSGDVCDERIQRLLTKKMHKVSYILAFMNLMEDIRKQNQDFYLLYLRDCMKIFRRLSSVYANRPDEQKACFAYVVSKLNFGLFQDEKDLFAKSISSLIASELVPYVISPSVYVRENAFRAIISIGNPDCILLCLNTLNKTPSHQNEKLIGDDLLAFIGDHQLLADKLFKNFENFNYNIQVAIINYLRLLPKTKIDQNRYHERLLEYLKDVNLHKEVRIAIIRYFGKYTFNPVYEHLLSFLFEQDERQWEYAAISATSLRSYPGNRTTEALYSVVTSRNWYIRQNAAESLISLETELENAQIKNTDKYAAEMIFYRNEIKALKETAKRKVEFALS